jgi:putative MFS transporter
MLSFEEITENKIGFGSYQYLVMFSIGLILIADGIEMSGMSLILPIITEEWKISQAIQGLLGTTLFLGFFVGSILGAIYSDRIGRMNSLQYVSLMQFFVGLVSCIVNNVYLFLLVRFLFGGLLGFMAPVIPSLCIELTPSDRRGRTTVVLMSLFSVGQFMSTVIAFLTLQDLTHGNWRLMLFICSFPPLFVFYGCYRYLKESPRYILLKEKDVNKGLEVLNYIGRFNNPDFKGFTHDDVDKLNEWRNHLMKDPEDDFKRDFLTLVNDPKYKMITYGLWGVWFCITFLMYGLVFILPFFLTQAKNGLLFLVITSLGEGSSGILAYFIVDVKLFGRKNSLAMTQIIASLMCFIAFIVGHENKVLLIASLTLGRFFCKLSLAFIYPLTAELYPTALRTLGIGLSSSAGRIASCIMPLVAIRLFYINPVAPFFMYGVVGAIGLFFTRMIPYDTTGMFLDMEFSEQM